MKWQLDHAITKSEVTTGSCYHHKWSDNWITLSPRVTWQLDHAITTSEMTTGCYHREWSANWSTLSPQVKWKLDHVITTSEVTTGSCYHHKWSDNRIMQSPQVKWQLDHGIALVMTKRHDKVFFNYIMSPVKTLGSFIYSVLVISTYHS